jgi:Rad3-related DNA helicase
MGTFKEIETYAYQDEIGLNILTILRDIPGGVLVFMPSYGCMDKLARRWKQTGLLKKIEEEKEVFQNYLII